MLYQNLVKSMNQFMIFVLIILTPSHLFFLYDLLCYTSTKLNSAKVIKVAIKLYDKSIQGGIQIMNIKHRGIKLIKV